MAGSVDISSSRKLPFKRQMEAFRTFKSNYPRFVGNIAVNFYKDSFTRQGWISDSRLERWKKRKYENRKKSRRGILIKSGALRRSIRVLRVGLGYVVVGSPLPYAKIHNEGGRIRAVQNIGSFRRRYRRTGRGRQASVTSVIVKAHKRRVNTVIPKRQYMGPSEFVNKRILMKSEYELKRILNIK
ncbi:phage virion morphogenesis protein [Sphingobacterium spiritivorum]|uniref:phage virion morphogenesis protein n=1 Tax=Sphingobacterium spiritivorum TaxID=258 RepID=UPI003DA5D97C